MKTVAQIFDKPYRRELKLVSSDWPLPDQMIGIEIEAENYEGSVFPSQLLNWNEHRDGSLRMGNEWVLCVPMKGDALATAIEEIFSPPTVLHRSTTGSTHIHLDMTEETSTMALVRSIAFLVYCLEGAIFQIGDPGREWCGYTNRLSSGPEILIGSVLLESEDENNYINFIDLCRGNTGVGRYYGLNLLALAKYGSLEFRYFPTAINKEELHSWIRLVMCIKKAAEAHTPIQLLEIFHNEDRYEHFINTYFHEWRDTFLKYVPYHLAGETGRKAIAAATACTIDPPEEEEDMQEVINSNEVLKKFVVEAPDVPDVLYPVVFSVPGQDPIDEHALDDMVVYVTVGDVYIKKDGYLRYILDDIPNMTYRHYKNVIASLAAACSSPPARYTREFTNSMTYHINSIRTRLIDRVGIRGGQMQPPQRLRRPSASPGVITMSRPSPFYTTTQARALANPSMREVPPPASNAPHTWLEEPLRDVFDVFYNHDETSPTEEGDSE